jgi:hypothetical protein
MGDVYRARDSRLNREVALKVLSAHLAGDPTALSRFEREAQSVAALTHPNILAIHDYGTADGVAFTVTELLEGETLRTRLADGALPPRKAIEYGIQIVRGIAAAHERGIIHRDIKPENIFLTRDGGVKLLDFGLAKTTAAGAVPNALAETQLNADTTPGTVLGTVGYMSPEQVRGQALDHRTDIFSFGAVLYEMLAGRRPFRGDSQVETMNAILKEDPPEISSATVLPGALDRIVRRCLEKQPADRFHSAHDLAIALEAVSGGSSAASGSGLAIAPATRVPSRGRVGLLAAAAAVVVAAGGAFFAGRVTSHPPVASLPEYHRLTFKPGAITSALFTPGGDSAVYSARLDDQPAALTFSTHVANPDSLLVGFPAADLVALSPKSELAIVSNRRSIRDYSRVGTLARAPMSGGGSRVVMEDVQDAAWLPDGSNLVVSHYANGRYQLDFPIGHVVYETTGWISFPRVSSDGKLVAFIDHSLLGDDRGAATIVDQSGHKTTLSPTYDSVVGLAWGPGDHEVWFAAATQGASRSLRAASLDGKVRTVLATPGALTLSDIAPNGDVLLTEDSTRRGLVGLAPGEKTERDFSILDWSLATAISDDDKYVLVSEEGDGGGPGYSVFLRPMDGSAAVRLGAGEPLAISADSKWVIAARLEPEPTQLVLMPTGAGETRQITNDTITHLLAAFLPGNKEFLFTGFEPGKRRRTWIQPVSGGGAKPVTPEGIASVFVTPDGSAVVALDSDSQLKLFPLNGGPSRPLHLDTDESPVRFADNGDLFVRRPAPNGGVQILRVNQKTGAQTPLQLITPRPGTVRGIGSLQLSHDGRGYVSGYAVIQSTLFLVTNVR